MVRRHGPAVLGVCRRCSARGPTPTTRFRPPSSRSPCGRGRFASRRPSAPGCTASRCGVAGRRWAGGRGRRPATWPDRSDPFAEVAWRELRGLLDEELNRLPATLRAPLILCLVEGRARDEAARSLGWSLRTFDRRLARGRAVLKARLARRGVGALGLGLGVLNARGADGRRAGAAGRGGLPGPGSRPAGRSGRSWPPRRRGSGSSSRSAWCWVSGSLAAVSGFGGGPPAEKPPDRPPAEGRARRRPRRSDAGRGASAVRLHALPLPQRVSRTRPCRPTASGWRSAGTSQILIYDTETGKRVRVLDKLLADERRRPATRHGVLAGRQAPGPLRSRRRNHRPRVGRGDGEGSVLREGLAADPPGLGHPTAGPAGRRRRVRQLHRPLSSRPTGSGSSSSGTGGSTSATPVTGDPVAKYDAAGDRGAGPRRPGPAPDRSAGRGPRAPGRRSAAREGIVAATLLASRRTAGSMPAWPADWQVGEPATQKVLLRATVKPPVNTDRRWQQPFAAISPDGKLVAIPSENLDDVGLWDIPGRRLLRTLTDKSRKVKMMGHLAFSADGRHVLAGGENIVYRWDAATGAALPPSRGMPATGPPRPFTDSDCKSLVTVDDNGMIRRWEPTTGKQMDAPHGYAPYTMTDLSSDGAHAVIADGGGRIDLWTLGDGLRSELRSAGPPAARTYGSRRPAGCWRRASRTARFASGTRPPAGRSSSSGRTRPAGRPASTAWNGPRTSRACTRPPARAASWRGTGGPASCAGRRARHRPRGSGHPGTGSWSPPSEPTTWRSWFCMRTPGRFGRRPGCPPTRTASSPRTASRLARTGAPSSRATTTGCSGCGTRPPARRRPRSRRTGTSCGGSTSRATGGTP